MAHAYRLLHALHKFLEALRGLSPDVWHSCFHLSTSPIPRAVGGVDDIGDFPLFQGLWDFRGPEFYRSAMRDFNAEESWLDGDRVVRGASRWVL